MSDLVLNNLANPDYSYKIGYNFKTEISQSIGGTEQRRARWDAPLRKYTLPFGNRYIPDIKTLMQFFYDRKGMYESFYFFDPTARMAWTIPSTSKIGSPIDYVILPFRPVINANTLPYAVLVSTNIALFNVVVKVDGITRTTNMTIDPVLGIIYFSAPKPLAASVITVEYDHLVRVRFNTDLAEFSEITYNVGNVNFELIECR